MLTETDLCQRDNLCHLPLQYCRIFNNMCIFFLQVKIWFQNRRTKWKKHDTVTTSEQSDPSTITATSIGSKSSPKPSTGTKFLSEGDDHSSLEDSESCYSGVDVVESKVVMARTPESLPPTSPPDNDTTARAPS